MARLLVLCLAFVAHTDALVVGGAARLQQRRAATHMGIFDAFVNAFMEKEEFDDRSAKAQHILLKGGDIDARTVAAEAIKTKIEAGETTFEAAAREFSECSSRAETPAGSLGTFGPGKMVAAFDAYVFNPASPIGEIGVVETEFGTHLIKVNERSDKFDPTKTKTDGGYSL